VCGEGGERLGFGMWVIGNLFWVAYGVVTANPYVMVMFGFYWVMVVVGAVNSVGTGFHSPDPQGR